MRKFSMGLLLLWLTGLSPFLPAQEINPDAAQKFRDSSVPLADRVNDLVARLTLEEKVLQMQNQAPAIPRLGIPAYNWWSECLHGVGRNGIATVFPQAIGMAATWDPELIRREADVISTEAWAKYREALEKGQHGVYQGLTFYTPNINIFRDPRWGRGQETYGEDPFLTGRIGVALVKGLQGNDPKYLKVVATAKHFAVHSGPESSRHSFDAWCSDRDLFETYLPAFEALVRDGAVYSVMGAYNRFRSEPCCSNTFLMDDILRKKWGFQGYITTDCGAIWDIWHGHGLQPDEARSAAMGLRAGCDLTCGTEYASLPEAVKNGFISEAEIDQSVKRLFTARFKLGMFDPDDLVKWAGIPAGANNTEENRLMARQVARESIVLLKNDGKFLPLSKSIKSIAVIGPYADRTSVLLGNYNGDPENPVTILQGIKNLVGRGTRVNYAIGVTAPEDAFIKGGEKYPGKGKLLHLAMEAAEQSEVIIFVAGISPLLEGEELQVRIPGFSGGDRTTLDLPANQTELLEKLAGTGKPIILVLTNGSALSVGGEAEKVAAVVEAWYPGQEGGNALADVLFGDYNPAGRLPVTFYRSVNDLPLFEDYSMKGRTYRYFKGKPLFAFGHGLSYASFAYSSPLVDKQLYTPADTIVLQVKVKNTGRMDGDEVIQVYASKQESVFDRPVQSLVGFIRLPILAGTEKAVILRIPVRELRIYNPEVAGYLIEPGLYQLNIGAASDDIRVVQRIRIR
jgi:beta-glucosidase